MFNKRILIAIALLIPALSQASFRGLFSGIKNQKTTFTKTSLEPISKV